MHLICEVGENYRMCRNAEDWLFFSNVGLFLPQHPTSSSYFHLNNTYIQKDKLLVVLMKRHMLISVVALFFWLSLINLTFKCPFLPKLD